MPLGQGTMTAPLPPSLNSDPVRSQSATSGSRQQYFAVSRGDATPYLTLRGRLSQVWLNRWTFMLMLILARLLLLLGSLFDQLGDAQVRALSACTKVEDVGSAVASGPHYLSVGVNHLIAHGITSAVSGMVDILMLILTAVEELIMFVINWYIGTYVCLTAAFVHGGLDVAVAVVEGADKFFNDNMGKVADGLGHSVDDVNAAIDQLWKLVQGAQGATTAAQGAISDAGNAIQNAGQALGNAAGSILGGLHGRDVGAELTELTVTVEAKAGMEALAIRALTEPHLDISGFLNSMRNIHINSSQFVGDLISLNKSIPTFDQAKNVTQQAIGIPLGWVKEQLNSTYGAWKFNASVLPVADKEPLTFCSTNTFIQDFFVGLFKTLATAKYVMIAFFIILALLACVFWGFVEVRRWHTQVKRARLFTVRGFDALDVVYIVERSFTAWAGIKISQRFCPDKRRSRLLMRWAVAYATTRPALLVLAFSVAGLFGCAVQAVILSLLQKEAPGLTAQVASFSQDVVQTLGNISTKWADESNSHVVNLENDINKDVLGWVVNATTAVNNTLNTIENEINTVLATAFNNTVLYNTIVDVVRCLVTSKIDQVEKGLTWVHDNAHVTLPKFPDDVFSQGANESLSGDDSMRTFLASPSSVTTDEVSGALDRVILAMRNSFMQELFIYLACLLIYIIVVLGGILYAVVQSFTPDQTLTGDPNSRLPNSIGDLTIEKTADDNPRSPLTGGIDNSKNEAPSFDENRGQAI